LAAQYLSGRALETARITADVFPEGVLFSPRPAVSPTNKAKTKRHGYGRVPIRGISSTLLEITSQAGGKVKGYDFKELEGQKEGAGFIGFGF
jgi:hypothetical protein